MDRTQQCLNLLYRVIEVIDSTDPESVDNLDSGADSIALLCELNDDIRDLICSITGIYPEVTKEDHDINYDRTFQET
jgi:hypothetical protein